MSAVYVVSYAPADDQGGVGGFDWRADRVTAEEVYIEAVRESAHEVREGRPGHVVRLVEFNPGWGPYDADTITEIIDADLGLIEVRYPARRQYVPPTTTPRYVPTGGLDRPTPRSKS